jgi:hypothetical protein
MLVVPLHLSDSVDTALLCRVNEAWDRYSQQSTPDNLAVYQRVFRQFANWVLRKELPEDFAHRAA